ncbi:MAG: hypothetical protein MSH49_02270 [[Eubacterium] saphenum]|nr:hypothetical protein [[Eubacterium] saphenum]
MGVGAIGAGSTLVEQGSFGKTTKSDLENMINRVKLERENYRKNAENSADEKKISELDNRLKNLQTRLDKLNEKQDGECQTCKNRKYQDGSDDPGVSFKSASKVGPEGAAAAVRGHEYEHVYRNQAKAAREGKEVVYQSVRIKTAICPECGDSYVAGGETTTVTKTKPETVEPTEQKDNAELAAKPADDKKTGGNESASAAEELQKKFGVGLYDREVEVGQFLNIVA